MSIVIPIGRIFNKHTRTRRKKEKGSGVSATSTDVPQFDLIDRYFVLLWKIKFIRQWEKISKV